MDEKEKLTVRDAFAKLIEKRGWYVKLEIPMGTATTMMRLFRSGKGITDERMREVLTKAGGQKVQEELWQI